MKRISFEASFTFNPLHNWLYFRKTVPGLLWHSRAVRLKQLVYFKRPLSFTSTLFGSASLHYSKLVHYLGVNVKLYLFCLTSFRKLYCQIFQKALMAAIQLVNAELVRRAAWASLRRTARECLNQNPFSV